MVSASCVGWLLLDRPDAALVVFSGGGTSPFGRDGPQPPQHLPARGAKCHGDQ
jgi:hypothetical protein